MKAYKIKVNGKEYLVEVEEAKEGTIASQKKPEASGDKRDSSGDVKVEAPMQGNVFSIKASTGQSVKKGEILLILEAMKLENEIISPVDGRISAVNVKEGQVIDSGTLLFEIAGK